MTITPSRIAKRTCGSGVQQHVEVHPWILVENQEASRCAKDKLPKEKTAARVDTDIARLDDEAIFRHDDQIAADDEEVDGDVVLRRVATRQPHVQDDDPLGVGGLRDRSHCQDRQKKDDERNTSAE